MTDAAPPYENVSRHRWTRTSDARVGARGCCHCWALRVKGASVPGGTNGYEYSADGGKTWGPRPTCPPAAKPSHRAYAGAEE